MAISSAILELELNCAGHILGLHVQDSHLKSKKIFFGFWCTHFFGPGESKVWKSVNYGTTILVRKCAFY